MQLASLTLFPVNFYFIVFNFYSFLANMFLLCVYIDLFSYLYDCIYICDLLYENHAYSANIFFEL